VKKPRAGGDYAYMCAHYPGTNLAEAVSYFGMTGDECMVCGLPLTRFRQPDKKMMIFCNSWGKAHFGVAADHDVVTEKAPGGTIACFVDGHVEVVSGDLMELVGHLISPN